MIIDIVFIFVLAAVLLGLGLWRARRGRGGAFVFLALALVVAAMIWNEYGWFDRARKALPPGQEVVQRLDETSFLRPWTRIVPITSRFVALDRNAIMPLAGAPAIRRTQLLLVARWQPTRGAPVAFDCAGARRADLSGTAELAADGTLTGTDWVKIAADDPLMAAVCREG